jgi:beta-lactamase regulating signal transducer with metallopeptidase domain
MSYLHIISDWANWGSRLALNHLWQATIFFLIALIFSLLLRGGPARARYLVWLAASVKFALPSMLIVLVLNSTGIKPRAVFDRSPSSAPTLHYIAPIVSPIVVDSPSLPQPVVYQSPANTITEARTTLSWGPLVLSVIWLLGVMFFLSRWLKQRHTLSSAIAAGHVVHAGRERRALTKVTSWLGITRQIDLVVTPLVQEPGVWRVFGPIVLFPESLVNQLSDEELESLMMHEMAHVLRWDNLVSNLNMVLCCVFWFNPIVWVIDTWLLKEREEACDDVVLRWSGSGETYAASIRKIYRFCFTSRMSGLSAAGGSTLKRRLERITTNHSGEKFAITQKLLVLAVVLASISFSVVAGMQPADNFVPRNSSVWQKATNGPLQQVAPPGRDECAEPDVKKCLPTQSAIASTTELGHVVVRSDTNAPSPIVSGSIASITEQLSETVRRTVATTRPAEQLPAFQSSHALDLRKFAGRYAVDPSVMENFVLDVSVIDGELWFKPSHAHKRRLIAQSAVDYVDSESTNTRISFILDNIGNVESLKLRGWGPTIIAPRLVLPAPSREGNVVFRLSGFSDARIVAVAGTFNGWNQSQYLFERVGNEWICRVSLPPGKYQYKFIVDGNWLVDPLNPVVVHDERDIENSQLIVH